VNVKSITAYTVATLTLVGVSCSRLFEDDEKLLAQFTAATCVPPSLQDSDGRHLWRERLTTASGLSVEIRGIDDPTGRIAVYFGPSDRAVAVDPGDFFAPKEVRLDAVREHLLVKSEGASAMGGGSQTRLLRYDLRRRERLPEIKIDDPLALHNCSPR
jgi:hypothetical protein